MLAAVVGLLIVEIATRTGISMAYIGGVFVAAAVLISPVAPLGGVAGLIIHDVFHGIIGYWTVSTTVWILSFAWVIVWLTNGHSSGQKRQGLKSMLRMAPAYAAVILIGGINATAFAAWLVMVLGAQRFYTAAIGFLPGVVAAVGLSVFGLVAIGIIERLGKHIGRADTRGHTLIESEVPGRKPSKESTGVMAVGVLVIGAGWLFGVSVLDVFVHDLGLYPTANEFSAFVTGFLGRGSPIAPVVTTALLGVYKYGELAVVLSAPVAIAALFGWHTYHDQMLLSTAHGIGSICTRASDD
ncbi:hypothetical protein [Haloarcula argentinensis]|uniref:Uncharacterized protein n=1 Tax=Haloarcula argentinensis TaxID=43776 RepID=A0ABU2EXZ5_HALAR|nr:hypothetical protein [Haloarcula argentinensis]EMA23693.1 hypothetical protein C443_08513 [Haloarcula argentinensis DSM 12282]MDS0252701.1 hypothetical protein [Haloarcula argentinensis]